MTTVDEKTRAFIRTNREKDVRNLALKSDKVKDIDLSFALTQIAGWQSIREKVPTWASIEEIIYPPHLPLEQCSSEATAIYKYGVVSKYQNKDKQRNSTLVDLTGGFGIDCWFMSRDFKQITYIERQKSLAEIAKHNFKVLQENTAQLAKCPTILVHSEDCVEWLSNHASPIDWVFIDPTRRDGHGGKTVAINDCEPNICQIEDLLIEKACQVMVKLSPMLDLTKALSQLRHVQEVHIVSIDNECKELLFLLSKSTETDASHTPIHCVNIRKTATQQFLFNKQEEENSSFNYANGIGKYLYEPNASILKAGAFKVLSQKFGVRKICLNSHLYTSDLLVPDFPGRVFEVEGTSSFNKKELHALLADMPKANLTIRNFPSSVAELRKRLHIAEGGDIYLFATTLHPQEKLLIKCRKS